VKSVRVDVLGTSFTVQTDEDPAYFSELLSYFRSRIALVESQTRIQDPLKLSSLAAILMADELFKLKDASGGLAAMADSPEGEERAAEEAERIALRLIADIEDKLPGA